MARKEDDVARKTVVWRRIVRCGGVGGNVAERNICWLPGKLPGRRPGDETGRGGSQRIRLYSHAHSHSQALEVC